MDIKELRARKLRLIKEMSDSINSFESDVGIMPTGINIRISNVGTCAGGSEFLLEQIEVDLDI